MTIEQNKAIVIRFHEAFDQGNLDAMEACFDSNAMIHFAGIPTPLNRDAFKQMSAAYLAAFPQGRSISEAAVVEGDLVAVRGVYRGTHQGEFMGIPATGQSIEMTWMSFSRVHGGKVVEHWSNLDTLSMLQQLGVVPVME